LEGISHFNWLNKTKQKHEKLSLKAEAGIIDRNAITSIARFEGSSLPSMRKDMKYADD